MPHGIGRDVLQRLLEALLVGVELQVLGHGAHELDVARAQDGIVALGDPLEQVVDGHGLDRQRAAAAFELRQIEQVADDRLELVGFAIDDVEVAAARGLVHREVRHGERLCVAADGGERRHQLVRHVGKQLTPRRVRGIAARRCVLRARPPCG